ASGWTADSQGVYVENSNAIPSKIDVLDVKTGQRKFFREYSPADPSGVPGLGRISRDAGRQVSGLWCWEDAFLLVCGRRAEVAQLSALRPSVVSVPRAAALNYLVAAQLRIDDPATAFR